jgi:hypothetical protein
VRPPPGSSGDAAALATTDERAVGRRILLQPRPAGAAQQRCSAQPRSMCAVADDQREQERERGGVAG